MVIMDLGEASYIANTHVINTLVLTYIYINYYTSNILLKILYDDNLHICPEEYTCEMKKATPQYISMYV